MDAIKENEPLAAAGGGAYGAVGSPPKKKPKGLHRRDVSDWDAAFPDEHAEKEGIRQVTYDDRNHISVLFQMHGSVWPRVFPFCIFNVVLTIAIFYGKKYNWDTTLDPIGHKFMGMVVSFLLVQQANIVYGRFMEARKHLSVCYKSCRELVQYVSVLTMDDTSETAKQWRQRVAYRVILMLRVTMAVLEFQSQQATPWRVPEMSEEEQADMEECIMLHEDPADQGKADAQTQHLLPKGRVQKWAHGKRSMSDEAFRAPVVLAFNLRREIFSQRSGGVLTIGWRHPCNEETRISDFVTEYMKAFHGLKKLTTTPLPFPLVQMSRTFAFFWVFTLPFALCKKAVFLPQLCFTVFFTTYGFIGLMYVTMELNDPFGDDPNDFDDLGMAQMVFEDIYITLYKLDGERSAYQLRKRILGRMKAGDALFNYRKTYGEMGLREGTSPSLTSLGSPAISPTNTFDNSESSMSHPLTS